MWQEKKNAEEKRIICNPVFFDIVYKTMEKGWEQYTLAGLIDPSKNFVDCKDLHLGDKNMFVGEING